MLNAHDKIQTINLHINNLKPYHYTNLSATTHNLSWKSEVGKPWGSTNPKKNSLEEKEEYNKKLRGNNLEVLLYQQTSMESHTHTLSRALLHRR